MSVESFKVDGMSCGHRRIGATDRSERLRFCDRRGRLRGRAVSAGGQPVHRAMYFYSVKK